MLSLLRQSTNFSHERLPELFLLAGIVLGVPYALFTGTLDVPDEEAHFYRAYETSKGFCKGVPGILSAVNIRRNDRTPWVELRPGATGAELAKLIDNPKGGGPYNVVSAFSVVNLYSCVGYLPAGGAIRLGRWFGVSPLTMMYLGRFANLATYLLLIFLALRLLPDFRAPLLVLAVMPMALHQAASLSIDAVTISLSILLSAYILMLAFDPKVKSIETHHYLILAGGVILLALCKASVGLVLLTILIPPAKFSSRFGRWLTFAGYTALALATMLAWQYVNRSNGEIFDTLRGMAGIHVRDSLLRMAEHPLDFLNTVARTLMAFSWELPLEFVGKLGWLNIPLPWWIVVTYPMILVLTAAMSTGRVKLSTQDRVFLAAIFVLNILSVFVLVDATWTPFVPNASDGTRIIAGVQGRYLIPFAFPLLVAMAGPARIALRYKPVAIAVAGLVVVANAIALSLLWTNFDARTSTLPNRFRMVFQMKWPGNARNAATLYQGRLVSRKGKAGPDEPLFFVDQGARHPLQDGNWMARSGYRWPDDVDFLAPGDLEAIPVGDPLQRAVRARATETVHLSNEAIVKQEAQVFGDRAGDIPVTGDWNGDGRTKIGIYRAGFWLLDFDGNGVFNNTTGKDLAFWFGGLPGDVPVTGDWSGDGRTKVGIYRAGFWILDFDGNGAFDNTAGKDLAFWFGGSPGDIPVVGDWTGDGKTKVGVYRSAGLWVLDSNGNGAFDGTGPGQDRVLSFGGVAGDIPVVGDWSGDGVTNVGVYRWDHYWILDINGHGNFGGSHGSKLRSFQFGRMPGDVPVVGDWNGDGRTKVGVFRKGHWILDFDGSGQEQ